MTGRLEDMWASWLQDEVKDRTLALDGPHSRQNLGNRRQSDLHEVTNVVIKKEVSTRPADTSAINNLI